MQIVVPLAGPDFERSDGTVKALLDVDGVPLLRRALESRPWWRDGSCAPDGLTFVLRDTPVSRAFAADWLARQYPGCRTVMLSHATQGAALSALAGVALIAHRAGPVVIDLVDILYDADVSPAVLFAANPGLGGIALVFESGDPAYSYLRTGPDGYALEAAEKRPISRHASAGTYAFRSPSALLQALAVNLAAPAAVTYNGLFYVCPVFNGVIEAGLKVQLCPVTNVRDIKQPWSPVRTVAPGRHRNGLMSRSGVPSRQSSPRTIIAPSPMPVTATIDAAMGFGRMGERKANVPVGPMPHRGTCIKRSRRALFIQ